MLHKMFFLVQLRKIFGCYSAAVGIMGVVMDNGLKKKQPWLLKDELPETTEQTSLLVPKIDQIQQILGVLYIFDDCSKLKD